MVRRMKPVVTVVAAGWLMAGAAAGKEGDLECQFDHLAPAPIHLSPGQSAPRSVLVTLQTNAPVEGLPPYEWRLGPSSLGSASPAEGSVGFRLWEEELLYSEGGLERANLGGFGARIDFDFTAGSRSGSETLQLRLLSTAGGEVPLGCRGVEIPVPVTVGGEWGLTAQVSSNGAMTTVGEWLGTFRLVEGGRIEGDGTITTTVTGGCVWGRKAVPMRITGHLQGETMYLTIVGEDDDSEPDTRIEESLECVIKSLIELPSFFAGLARFAEMIVMNEPCPLPVPADMAGSTTAECAGVTFHIRQVGGS